MSAAHDDRDDVALAAPACDALPLARSLAPLMDIPDLHRELLALRPLTLSRARDLFRGDAALRRAATSWLLPHAADVTVHDDGSWQPGGADPVIIVPVWSWPPDDIVDLVAIDLRTDRAYLRAGVADALGQHRVNSVDAGVTLVLHDSPSAWLRSGGLGICPLAPAFLPHLLGRGDITLVAETVEDGEALRRRLIAALPPLPKIAVRGVRA
jgi:hypothetical protein